MNEDRKDFLTRKLSNSKNIYKGSIFEDYIKYEHPNYLDAHKKFAFSFGTPSDYNNVVVRELVTRDDLIINNSLFYIIFVGDIDIKVSRSLKLHLVENFLVNWDTIENYIYKACPDEINHLTISSITSNEIYSRDFEKGLIPIETILSDIQFIDLKYNDPKYNNSYFDEVIRRHISVRNGKGLITIILYHSSQDDYARNNYEDEINLAREIKRYSIEDGKVKVVNSLKDNKVVNSSSNEDNYIGALSEGGI